MVKEYCSVTCLMEADCDLHVNIIFFCSRAMGDASSAVSYFEESVQFLSKLPKDDMEVFSSEHFFCAVQSQNA